jgi:hypothetical protein
VASVEKWIKFAGDWLRIRQAVLPEFMSCSSTDQGGGKRLDCASVFPGHRGPGAYHPVGCRVYRWL